MDLEDFLGWVLNVYKLVYDIEDMCYCLYQVVCNCNEDEVDGIVLLMGYQCKELVDWVCVEGVVKVDECEQLEEVLIVLYDVIWVDVFEGEGIKVLVCCVKGKCKVVEWLFKD